MSNLTYPAVTEYQLPKKNIIVIGCIDLRLTDDVLNFLDFDNLTNRYDIVTLAGTSVSTGATRAEHTKLFKPEVLQQFDSFKHWKQWLYDHIKLAIALHQIEDVYIIEHEDCGAYKAMLVDSHFPTWEDQVNCHKKFAVALSKDIQSLYNLNVHCFMIDIRGNVRLLDTANGA
jgi:hypothetical protein